MDIELTLKFSPARGSSVVSSSLLRGSMSSGLILEIFSQGGCVLKHLNLVHSPFLTEEIH